MRRSSGWAAGIAVLALAGGGAAAAATGFGFESNPGQQAEKSAAPPATAKVTRETLVDTEKHQGDLGYGEATTLNGKLAGTVTGLPAPGATVRRGQSLYRVDDTPVVLMYGALPMYRPLAKGTEGADVRQLEQNLAALGYTGFTVDDEFSERTTSAVKQWQKSLGLEETGVIDVGRIAYARGVLRVDALKAAVGDAAAPGTPVLTYTGLNRRVTVSLDLADQRLAKRGTGVSVVLPDGKKVNGTITGTRSVTNDDGGDGGGGDGGGPPGGGGESKPTIEVTVTLQKDALTGTDRAKVGVLFTATKRENVLTVPVAALLALSDGGYGVQVVDGSSTRILPVETGMFADGRVEVAGDGLSESTTVVMPS